MPYKSIQNLSSFIENWLKNWNLYFMTHHVLLFYFSKFDEILQKKTHCFVEHTLLFKISQRSSNLVQNWLRPETWRRIWPYFLFFNIRYLFEKLMSYFCRTYCASNNLKKIFHRKLIEEQGPEAFGPTDKREIVIYS